MPPRPAGFLTARRRIVITRRRPITKRAQMLCGALSAAVMSVGVIGVARAASGSVPPVPPYSECIAKLHNPCYTAADLERAYGLKPLYAQGLTGAGSTIVVVDPFGSPTNGNDLTVFDEGMGLPNPPHFRIIQPTGPVPPYNPDNAGMLAKAGETTLDVEWAHAIAPGANILLVRRRPRRPAPGRVLGVHAGHRLRRQARSRRRRQPELQPARGELRAAREDRAAAIRVHPRGPAARHRARGHERQRGEWLPAPGKTLYSHRVQWPATDPLVTGIGGTRLSLSATGQRLAPDEPWNDTWVPVAALGPVPHPWATSGGV